VAMKYRMEFGKVYEATIRYIQCKKRSLIRSLPDPKVSIPSIQHRIEYKSSEKAKEFKYKERNEELEQENTDLKEEVKRLERELMLRNLTIADITNKWCKQERQNSIAYLVDQLKIAIDRRFRETKSLLDEIEFKVKDMLIS
jgi:hypothetical protein